MGRCFVIQPFDKGGKFDKRYKDIFYPAIESAGLEPYRVDNDPSVSIPIEDIKTEIGAATACLADITIDNPNVWFELGWALCNKKEVVLVCAEERESDRFPFDVQHLKIITYTSDSTSDFEQLKNDITQGLRARLERRKNLGLQMETISSVLNVQGLNQHEIATLVAVAGNVEAPQEFVPANAVKTEVVRGGFQPWAFTLGIQSMLERAFLEIEMRQGEYGEDLYVYRLTQPGISWLADNASQLQLRMPEGPEKPESARTLPDPDDPPF